MSNYKGLYNDPNERARITYPYVYWEEAFNNEELDAICELGARDLVEGTIAGKKENHDGVADTPKNVGPVSNKSVRSSKVSFHKKNDETEWIFERLNGLIEMCNNRWYNYDLNGYEAFQYTEYHWDEEGHYDWHVDTQFGVLPYDNLNLEMRKLSLTLLLNDPAEDFEGGELQIGSPLNPETCATKKGTAILFPSFQLHRVAPVRKGIRKSLVVWVLGPKFK